MSYGLCWVSRVSEKTMRGRLVKDLRSIDFRSIENWVGPGTPDSNYVEGWVELKWARSWPVKPGTPVVFEHYTPQQKVWQMRRWSRGGRVFVLVQIGLCWMLYDAPTAVEILGKATKSVMIDRAWKVWHKGLKVDQLIEWLCHMPLPVRLPRSIKGMTP